MFAEAIEVLRELVMALGGGDFLGCYSSDFYDEVYTVQKNHAYPLIIREPIRLYLYVPP